MKNEGHCERKLLIKTITSLFFGKCAITCNKLEKNNRNNKTVTIYSFKSTIGTWPMPEICRDQFTVCICQY